MKVNDAVWGALLLLLSAALLVHVQSFPRIPGQQVGPALFPGIIAVALGVCGLLLVVQGVLQRREGGERAAWVALEDWSRDSRYVVAFLATIAVLFGVYKFLLGR